MRELKRRGLSNKTGKPPSLLSFLRAALTLYYNLRKKWSRAVLLLQPRRDGGHK